MKSKLRKITINAVEYLYSVSNQYHSETKTNTLTVKVFLNGQKQTPLIIKSLTVDDYVMGQPLQSGVKLVNKMTGSEDEVNLNRPKYIRQFIVLGLKKGWSGFNSMEIQNGLDYLNELGFETDQLKPENNR
ncbi:hypothetical protein J2795_000384 [Chryseobacterium bernardetii]|uniref:Phage protein n=3 Tax=Chryseobacterium TaxID=59732 RepID=A0A543EN23_9FLAO|nr:MULTISPECIES: hypothetical protein [Chryseobacterium]MDR6369379.1 hypothetical protein [Chryseobacterium vietnamense]MDR6439699.1 hypothetical protein [Chryseobacterium bernardetii]MDR6459295.1 hypothetical protein [Chryseobacterium vietnamense]MDR6487684.1 hypothetical protein [Chryseobacterium vietnamense]TQM22978.1 hypothetical protein FB551_2702 [Chryseobacterium aquifrigidense]